MSASFVMPSMPGLMLLRREFTALDSSYGVTRGAISSGQASFSRAGCTGNSPPLTCCNTDSCCSSLSGRFLISLPITSLYGLPQGSCSTWSQSFFQHRSFASLIALNSSNLTFFISSISAVHSPGPTFLVFLWTTLREWLVAFLSEFSADVHQYTDFLLRDVSASVPQTSSIFVTKVEAHYSASSRNTSISLPERRDSSSSR